MKASLRWLRELVDLPDDHEAVGESLDLLGIEVESTDHLDRAFDGVAVARVLEIGPHPDADRLRVVTVDHGDGESTVVCGAWNFDVGDVVAYAPPGSRLAGGLDVGEREIRGIVSPGMICSEKELGLGDDADGIMLIDESEAPVGSDLADAVALPDVVFDVSITSNRPDLMSMYGLARDLAAYFSTEARLPELESVPPIGEATVEVRVEAQDRCPRFTAREVHGVAVGPSPLWMRTRLRAVGIRPISNVVDITNYVMLEVGQPLHAFDLARVGDRTVVVRTAAEGEEITTLDGETRSLRSTDLVIADAAKPIGLAGVMGGEDSEVSPATVDVLVEAAHFAAAGVLFTGKHHGLRTEASARFERGVDPELPPVASARATALLVRLGGGTVVGDLIDERSGASAPTVVTLAVSEVERLLGVEIPADQIRGILERLGFSVEDGDPMTVGVPTFRPDVSRPADLVEEVARLYGLDRIPERLPKGPGLGLPERERARRFARQVLVGAGFYEMLSFDFVAPAEVAAFGFEDRRGRPLRVRNPLSDEHGHLRTSLLPGLLAGLRTNVMRNVAPPPLFEVGSVFLESDGPLPDQPHLVAFVAVGELDGTPGEMQGTRDARDAAGTLATLFGAFGVPYVLDQAALPGLHPGRGARVLVDGSAVGFVGELHPEVADAFGLRGRVGVAEVEMGALTRRAAREFNAPSAMPPVVVDLAFDLAEEVPASRLLEVVRGAAGPLLERSAVFDVFSGPPLEPGRRSIALRLTLRDPARTLTDDHLVPVREAIAARVSEDLGGRLRGG